MANDPITREEMFLNAVATGVSSGIEPITREEKYLAYIGGQDVIPPEPITRKEYFFSMISPGGGSGVTIKNQNKTVTENGTYKADSGYTGLGTVTVTVPQEEPVVEPLEVTENGTYNPPAGVDGYGPVTVNVETGDGGNDVLDGMISGSITHIESNAATLRRRAFSEGEFITIRLPEAVSSAGLAFSGCSKLADVYLPKMRAFSGSGQDFYGCESLELLDFPSLESIFASLFRTSKKLSTVILRNTALVRLDNKNAFDGTPFASGGTGGTVYVPSALIDSYKTATNWSALYAAGSLNFAAIEGSEYE